ncbi:hypothetical protein OAC41_04570 [Acidimicrobiales bacterium]|nr:hypothetical protein [Acidimicrobiales bacterium]
MPRSPHRFNDQQVEQQKAIALRSRQRGATWPEVADELTKVSPDGLPVDRETARRRYKSALTDFRVPREEWEMYRNKQLAELEVATTKVMTAVMTAVLAWDIDNGDEVNALAGLTGALVRLQARADTVIGFPVDPPAPPPANAGALDYVRRIVTNQPAHKAMLASMRAIEAEILHDDAPLTTNR